MRDARRQLGLHLFRWAVVALSLALSAAAQALTQDLTGQFSITRTGLVLNRTSNTFDSTVTLRNSSDAPVLAPIDVAVGGLPAGITLANKAGDQPDGRPYVSPMAAGALLQGGGTLSFVLKFANPSRVAFTSTLQILRTVVEAPANAPSLLGVVATGGTSAHLIGRVDGAASQDVTLQVMAASTCIAGTLVNGAGVGGTVTARTDADGYFQLDVSGVNPGAFVALQNAAAGSPVSLCQVSARDNDSWPKAFLLDGSAPSVRDLIDAPGRARWYKFAVTPGQRIDLKLSGLAADYDLAVFKDIGQAFASEFNPATAGPADLLKLTAEYAPSVFSPSVFSPSVFSPSVFSPDAYSPSVFSPSVFSPSVFSPSVFSPSVFSPSVFSPSVFSPSVFSPSVFSPSVFSPSVFSPSVFSATEIAQAFSTAQTRSIVAISATAGLSDEATVVNTWNRTGYFYARVTGRGGAFDTSLPFTLNVTKGVTTCVGVTDTVLTSRPAVAASGLKTVLLTDSSKVALDAALPGAAGGTLRERLAAFAARSEIMGVVVDVAGDGRVSALRQQAANNPACPYAKNLVAEEIKGIVDSYRANPLQYVVLVGNDDAIPFFRSPDQSAIGPESGYVPPVQSNSPSEASLRRDFVLSQDRYGSKTSIALPWNDFPVPGLAVGRLVETAGEIAGLLDAYVEADAVVTPRTSLVTGYDFLEDAASAVKNELDAGTGVPGEALITPNGTSPQAAASWTATQLRTKLFGSRHDVIFLAGHFSANSALAADFKTSLLTTDLAASTTDFTNSIVFSAGCHSGYNLVDGDAIPGVTLPLDWAQAFARKQATLIAGTGYQYGDTDFLEYSERLYNNLARQLRAGPAGTPVTVGEALVQAKLAYLAATPDIRGLHEKALLQATLFGLPMLGVNMPAGRGELPGTTGVIAAATVAAGPAASLGLQTYDLGVAPSLTARTQTLTNLQGGPGIVANWLSGPDGVVTKPGEPALPLAVVNVTPTVSGLVLRGIGYRGGSYVDSGPVVPFTGAATTESRGVHVPFLSPVFYPSTMWTPNYFGALAGNGGTQLLVTPVQYRAADVADGTSTQRRHTGMNLRLFYSGNLSQAALSDAPTIVAIDAQQDATGVTFSAQVVGDPAAAIHQVWVTYTGSGVGSWTSVDLSQCVAPLPVVCGASEDSRLWKGRLVSPPANLKYFVQAVNGVGLVARNDNVGAYFGIGSLTPAATVLALIAPPASAIVGDGPTVTAKLTYAGGVGLAGKMVAVGAGGAARLGTTGSDGTISVKMPVVADPGNYLITAAFAGDEAFQPSSASAPLTINRAAATPTVLPAGAASAGINITGALGGTDAGLQQVPVTFTVSGPSGTTTIFAITDYLGNAIFPPPSGLPPGDYTVTQASFGGDGTFAPTTITFPTPLQVSVPKLNQGITFGALADKTFGDPDFPLFASASSGLAVSYGASGNCTVAGSTVHLTGTGSCTINADQAGDATFNAAATASQTFAIGTPTAGPTVVSLVRAVNSPTMADSVTYTLTFSEAVSGVTAGNFAVATSGIAAASVGAVSGSDTTWTVTVNTGRGTGTLHLDLVNGTGITNTGGTPLAGTPFTGETYQIDKGGTVVGSGQGQLVTSFGTGGFALFTDIPIATTPGRLRVRTDGRILVAGGIGCATDVNPNDSARAYCTLLLAQYSASGVPDASFGTNGRVVTAVTSVNPEVNLQINSDGSFHVRGLQFSGTNEVVVVAKFTSAGVPDPSFGTNGVVTLDSLPIGFPVFGSVVDDAGRVYIGGTTPDTGAGEREDILVVRLTSTGAFDTPFGTNGIAQFALSTVDDRSDRGTSIDFQSDGKVLVGGRTKVTSGLGYDFLLMRLQTNGVRDPSFGTDGVVTIRFPGSTGDNLGRRFLRLPDDKIAGIGTVTVGAATQCGIARFNSNGTLDPAFGTGGQVLVPISGGCFGVTQQSDGKLVIVGNETIGDVSYGTFVRLLPTGALDTGFGNGGILDISNFDTPTRVAFTASGNIVTGLTIQDPADGVRKSYVVELSGTVAGPSVPQTLTFDPLPARTFGDVFGLSATASSGLAVTYAASGDVGVCSVAGNLVQLTGVGSCTITASQAGDATYLAATPQARTFAVGPANQTILFAPAPVSVTVGQPLVMISATSGSSTAPSTIPIVFSSLTTSICTTGGVNGASLTLVSAGQCTIAANQAGDGNFVAASQTLSFTVGAAGPPPSTFTVTNLDDSGAGSLRDAIAQANAHAGPDVVDLSGLSGTIVLTSGSIQISGPTLVSGPGADQLTIDGNATNRIFNVGVTFPACPALDGPDYLVTISGLRLVNGRRTPGDSSGGAIYTEHSLGLDDVIIEDSVARSGGGVAYWIQYPGQHLSIANSRFLNNTATELLPPTNSVVAAGGGLSVQERCLGPVDTVTDLPAIQPVTVNIANSEFRGNSSQPVTLYGRGGAIRSYSLADITISDTIIVDNHVDAPDLPVAGKNYHGGGIDGTAKSLRIERSEIAENTANENPGGDLTRSGGLHLYKDAVTRQGPGDTMAVKIINSTISGNVSSATAGAMVAYGNLALELSNSTVSDNVAAPTRTGGIIMSSGNTYPVSGSNTTQPTLRVISSILANSLTGADVSTNTATIPTFTINAANSLIEKICPTCAISVSGPGNLVQIGAVLGPEPMLGPLAFNGGTTRTHALLAGSPAIDAGSNPLGLTTDQRGAGFARAFGAAPDMGAYELGDPLNQPPVASVGADQNALVGQTVNLSGSCTDPDANSTLTFGWALSQRPPNSNATLANSTTAAPSFVPDQPGAYAAQLICNDGMAGSAPATTNVTVAGGTLSLTLVNTQLVGVALTAGVRVTLSNPAPTGGLVVTLASDNTAVLGVGGGGTVTIPQAGTEGTGTVSGVAAGSTTLRASASGYAPGSLPVTVSNNVITVGGPTNVVLNATATVAITISQPAPAGGLNLTVSSSDPAVISVVTPTVTIPQGQTSVNATLRGNFPGNVTVTAQATGFASGTAQASVGVTLDITVASVTFRSAESSVITIALKSGGNPAVAPPGGLPLTLASSDSTCVIAPSVTVPAGQESTTTTLTYGGGALPCTSTVTASGPAGTTSDTVAVTVTAASLRFAASSGDPIRVGAGLEECGNPMWVESYNPATGQVAPVSASTVVTLGSSNGAAVVVSPNDTTTVGGASTTVTIGAGSYFAYYCVAGVAGQAGATSTLTVSAGGFGSGTRAVSVLQPVIGLNVDNLNPTTQSGDGRSYAYVGIGSPTTPTVLATVEPVRKGGGALSVSFGSADTAVAQVVVNGTAGATATTSIAPGLYYTPTSGTGMVSVRPVGAGSVAIGATASGFVQSTGGSYPNPRTVTVTGTSLRFAASSGDPIRVGAGLEECGNPMWVESYNPATGQVAPVSASTVVTLGSSNGAAVVVSPNDTTTVGGASTTVTIGAGSYFAYYCVAGVAGQAGATSTLTVSAGGFGSGTRAVSVLQPVIGLNVDNLNPTTQSGDGRSYAYVGIGSPTTPTVLATVEPVRKGGGALSVSFGSADTAVAQVVVNGTAGATATTSIAPGLYYTPTSGTGMVSVRPVGAGSVAIGATASGFVQSTGGSYPNPRTVTVTGTSLRFAASSGDPIRVGAGLEECGNPMWVESYNPATGQVAPVSASTVVTLGSSNGAAVVVSPNDTTTVGGASTTVTIGAGSYFAYYCVAGVAGQAGATSTLTVSAGGFGSGTRAVSVLQPVIGLNVDNLNPTTQSGDGRSYAYVGIGSPTTPTVLATVEPVRKGGGALSVSFGSADTAVAQVVVNGTAGATATTSIAPGLYYTPTSGTGMVSVRPVGAGSVAIGATASGFVQSTGGSYPNPRTVTVTGTSLRFAASSGDPIRVGAGLEECGNPMWVESYNPATGQVAPVSASTVVTLGSSNGAAVVVSPNDTTTVGGASTTVTIGAGSYFAYYCVAGVAGQAGATSTLTVSAGGFGSGTRAVSVLQPVIGLNVDNLNPTTQSGDGRSYAYVGIGSPTTPTVLATVEPVRKGGGALSVSFGSADTAVAQVVVNGTAGATATTSIAPGLYYTPTSGTGMVSVRPVGAGSVAIGATASGFVQSTGGSYPNPRTVTVSQ